MKKVYFYIQNGTKHYIKLSLLPKQPHFGQKIIRTFD